MPSFRESLLTKVTGICQQLYYHRMALVQTQALVSESAKQDINLLIRRLDGLRKLDPFPEERDEDKQALDRLREEIDSAEGDQFAVQEKLMGWVKDFHPAPAEETEAGATEAPEATGAAASPAGIPPINQRMIDNLADFRAAIDKTRLKLMLKGDPADVAAYTAARNAFTLARAVYDERLKLDQLTPSNQDCAEMEKTFIPAVRKATGATFPGAIQAGADFISGKLFA